MTILRDPSGERLFLEGRLEGLGVPDLIHAICLPRRTGILTFSRAEVSKTIYIKNGQLVFAASNVAEDRLGETLLRDGIIGYSQLENAVSYMGGGKRLGSILVELGYLAPDKLVRGLLHQVKEIILSLFPWEGGAYRFVEEPLPTAEVITLNMPTSKLILDGIRRITAWPRIVRSVGYSRATYRLTREGRAMAEDLDLGAAERLILDSLERPVSVGEICRSVFLANFDVYQYLWAFRILGIIQQVESDADAAEASDAKDATRGELYDTPIFDLLLGYCRRHETGVLYLTRDAEEKSIHLKNGMVVFATSNRPDEGLTTFLLRRGVIGLRDKDEIERRLLSHRRAGTILREMGILTQDELVRFVREQLREIVLSAFSWERGEWRFLPGEPPCVEEVELDRPIEELVLQGIRSVRDWSRVSVGCGELNTVMRKVTSPPLSGPFAMGPDESEVLAVIDGPCSVAEICMSTAVTDHRVAQILWGFQVLGIVTREARSGAALKGAAAEPAKEPAAAIAVKEPAPAVAAKEPASVTATAMVKDAVSTSAVVAAPAAATAPPAAALVGAAVGAEATGSGERATSSAGTQTQDSDSTAIRDFSVKAPEKFLDKPSEKAPEKPRERTRSGFLSLREELDSASEELSSEHVSHAQAPKDGAPHGAASGEPHSKDSAPRVDASQVRLPRLEASRHATPRDEANGDTTHRDDAKRDATPRVEASNGTTPRDGASGNEAPASSAPARTPLEAVGSGVLEEIERFNRRHRELYAALRGAVGAGAKNFVATCIRRPGPASSVFNGLMPDESGAFSAESLYERVGSLDPMTIRTRLETLIDAESQTAGQFLDPRTLERLRKRLETATWDLAERT